jgi:anti-anti-sigma factor
MFGLHTVHPRERRQACAPQQLAMRSEREGHAHVIRLIGELDMTSARAFDEELKRVEATDARQIVVDLSGLKSICADGLKAFIQANVRARRDPSRLMLLRGPDHVHQTFETTGLLSRLPFADRRERSVLHGQSGAHVVLSRPIQKWAGAG